MFVCVCVCIYKYIYIYVCVCVCEAKDRDREIIDSSKTKIIDARGTEKYQISIIIQMSIDV